MPAISLIIASYNSAGYLGEMLDSIRTQTFADFEVLLIDDGSTDHTAELTKQVAKDDERIRYIYQNNAGVSVARNTGLAAAQGEYVAFADADDILHPDYLCTLIRLARENDADITLCGINVFNDAEPCQFNGINSPAHTLTSIQAVKQLLRGNIAPNIWNRLYRATLAKKRQFIPGLQLGEDLIYSAEIFSDADRICRCDMPLYGYRKRDGSLLSTYKPSLIADRLTMLSALKKCLNQNIQDAELQALFDIFTIRHVAYYGMKDLLRAKQLDVDLYRKLAKALRSEADLSLGKLSQANIPKNIKKWVAFPLIHPWLGERFLQYQSQR